MKRKAAFSGWTDVFRFTLKEITGKKSFFAGTLGIGIGIILLLTAIFTAISFSQMEEEKKPLALKNVYVVNDSDYSYLEFGKIDKVTFHKSDKALDVMQKEIYQSKEDALLHIEKGKGQNIICNLILPSESEVSESEGKALLEKITQSVQQLKLTNIGIDQSKLMTLLSPVTTMYSKQGEEPESVGEVVMKMLLPTLLIMILYFLTLFFGQSAGKIVSAEKTSKIIDTLLLSVKPYALILGKMTAVIAAGVLQILIFFAAILAGIYSGNMVGKICNENFSNPLYEVLDLMKQTGTGDAFTWWSVLLGIVVLILGFSFYMVVAGLVASKISKSEDLAQGMGLYQIVVVVGFMASYFTYVDTSTFLLEVEKWIPFTAAFVLPGELMLGGISLWAGVGMVLCLILFIFLAIILAARFYKNQVFYNGK